MKKLILLSFTLVLPFPGTHLLAGGGTSKQIQKKQHSFDILSEETTQGNVELSNFSAKISRHDWLVIQKYKNYLNHIYNPTLVNLIFKERPKGAFLPIWFATDALPEHGDNTKKIKQFILLEFVKNENVELDAARIIFDLFLEHKVDLNTRYIGITFDIPYNENHFPTITTRNTVGYTLLEKAKQENRDTPIIQALEEAIEKQKNQN